MVTHRKRVKRLETSKISTKPMGLGPSLRATARTGGTVPFPGGDGADLRSGKRLFRSRRKEPDGGSISEREPRPRRAPQGRVSRGGSPPPPPPPAGSPALRHPLALTARDGKAAAAVKDKADASNSSPPRRSAAPPALRPFIAHLCLPGQQERPGFPRSQPGLGQPQPARGSGARAAGAGADNEGRDAVPGGA